MGMGRENILAGMAVNKLLSKMFFYNVIVHFSFGQMLVALIVRTNFDVGYNFNRIVRATRQ